ncbi:hypothetical protein C1646_686046 [Rhizophagus diaphanus]|nr:hypothetical protein C1646_686046 [Rhizophagus diaphanus] [Rhizophagus sp. MUCL 43196]
MFSLNNVRTPLVRIWLLQFLMYPNQPKQTIALQKYLESLCLNEQVISRELLLRLVMYMLDCFVSQAWCHPFIKPVDESCIYRNIITQLMDLTTVEHNLWAGKYDVEVSKFYDDLFIMHPNSIRNIQRSRFDAYVFCQVNNGIPKPPHDLNKLDSALVQIGAKLPHEEFADVCRVAPNIERYSWFFFRV